MTQPDIYDLLAEECPDGLAPGCTCGECLPGCSARWLFPCCGACCMPEPTTALHTARTTRTKEQP